MALSLSGVLWLNGTTVINDQGAYNGGVQRISDYINSHTGNVAVGGQPVDQHNTAAILASHTSLSITQASLSTDTTLDVLLAEIMTRIHAIEGDGAGAWATGAAPTTLASINTAITTHTIHAAFADDAATADSADAFVAPQPLHTTISDYLVTPGGSGVLNVAAGIGYVDSAGNKIPPGSATTVTMPASPGSGNLQYCWITKPTVTGTPHASTTGTIGTIGSPPPIPAYPTGEEPLALVGWKGGVVATGDIEDIRYGHGGGTGLGGGTYTPAAPLVAIGSSGSTLPLDSLLAGGQLGNTTPVNGIRVDRIRIAETMIGGIYTDATLEDYLSVSVSGDVLGALQASGSTLQLRVPTGKPPITAKIGGKRMRADSTATITSNSVSAAGSYILAADLNGTGPLMALVLVSSLSALQVGLIQCWFDGVNFYITPPHGPAELTKPIINGERFQPLRQTGSASATSGSLAISAGITQITNAPTLTLDLPVAGLSALIRYKVLVTAGGTPGQFYVYPMWSSGAGVAVTGGGDPATLNDMAAAASHSVSHWHRVNNLAAGPFNASTGWVSTQAGYAVATNIIEVEVTR